MNLNYLESLHRRAALSTLMAVAIVWSSCMATTSQAALIVGSLDAAATHPSYPSGADVVTAPFPASVAAVATRDAGSGRRMAQSFQVTGDPIAVNRIYFGYQYLAVQGSGRDQNAPVTFRLLQIPDVFAVYTLGTETVLGSVNVVFGPEPAPDLINNPDRLYSLRLDWTGSPLLLPSLPGNQGYALEVLGSTTNPTAPIAIMRYTTSQYANGQYLEQGGSPIGAAGQAASEMVLAVTPEPSSFVLAAFSALAIGVGYGRRRNAAPGDSVS
jgi:hypothetical protein